MSNIPPIPDDSLDETVRDALLAGTHALGERERSPVYRVLRWWVDGGGLPTPPSVVPSMRMLRQRIENDTRSETLVEDVDVRQGLARRIIWRRAAGKRVGGAGNLGTRTLPGRLLSVGVVLGLLLVAFVAWPTRRSVGNTTRVYATNSHQQAVIVLDDGTRVLLAPKTTLRLIDFGTRARTIALEGEANVQVAHADGAPFVVQSGEANVQVLGTEFLIRHRMGEVAVRTVVASGKVRMTIRDRSDSGVTLTAGQIGVAGDSTVHVNDVGDLAPGTEWTHDQLVFHDVPLSTILATVSRWYGYQFRYADSTLARRTVTLGVSTQSSMEALATIEHVLHVNLKVAGDTVTLLPQAPQGAKEASRVKAYDVWTPIREIGR